MPTRCVASYVCAWRGVVSAVPLFRSAGHPLLPPYEQVTAKRVMSNSARVSARFGVVDVRSLYTARCSVHAARDVHLGTCHGSFTVVSEGTLRVLSHLPPPPPYVAHHCSAGYRDKPGHTP